MNTLPASLYNDQQLGQHASIGGLVILDDRTVCSLQGWGTRARVQYPSKHTRSLPRAAVVAVVHPVDVTEGCDPANFVDAYGRAIAIWMLSLYCCGFTYEILPFDSWDEADRFRTAWVDIGPQNGHVDRVGVIS